MGDVVQEIFAALSEPYPEAEIKWRIGSRTKDKKKIKPLCYVDARTVMDRLDEVVGPENWQDKYVSMHNGTVVCELTITIPGEPFIEITKSDGAGQTDIEGEKGQLSDAFKRASVKFGMGRYMYKIDMPYSPHPEGQSWLNPDQIGRFNQKLPNYIPKNADSNDRYKALTLEYRGLEKKDVLLKWANVNAERVGGLPESWGITFRREFKEWVTAHA